MIIQVKKVERASRRSRVTPLRVSAIAFGVLCTLLSGCANIQHGDDAVRQAARRVEEQQALAQQQQPVGVRTSGAWLLGEVVEVQPEVSPILLRKIGWNPGHKVSLAELASYVTAQTGLPVDVSEVVRIGGSTAQDQLIAPSINGMPGQTIQAPGMAAAGGATGAPKVYAPLPLLKIEYEGDVNGLLDFAANEDGIAWRLDNGTVKFFRTLTKTFFIPALSRHTNGANAVQAQSTANASGTGSTAGAPAAAGASTGGSGSSSGLNSTASDDVDFWKNIEATVKAVAGGDAQVATNSSFMSVTVSGSPAQVKNVETWAKTMSDHFSQQVLITLETYLVTLSSEDNYNFNPNAVYNKMSNIYNLTLTGAGAPPVAGSLAPAVLTANAGSGTNLNGSQVAFQALSTLGHVSEGITQSVLTVNGQPATIQIGNNKTYLASSGVTNTANVGSTSQLTPGVVSSGYTVKFKPNVIDGRVLLDMDLNDITLNAIDQITSNGSVMQQPNVSPTLITQSASLTPGQAMLMSSLTIDNNSVTRSGTGSPYNPLLGGGVDGTHTKKLVAVVVTARVL